VLLVDGNALTEITPSVTQLASLRQVSLTENPVQKLPDGIGDLPLLRILDLSDTRVPDAELLRFRRRYPTIETNPGLP
jgi:Leucine-rich repeat (LRR) protein